MFWVKYGDMRVINMYGLIIYDIMVEVGMLLLCRMFLVVVISKE